MQRSQRLYCLALSLLATGCYEASRPLGPPERGVLDAKLVGTWRCVDSSEKPTELAHLRVLPFDDAQYFLEWREDEKTERYRAYSTKLRETTLYNVSELKPDGAAKWTFHRLARRPDGSLEFRRVSRDALKKMDEEAAFKEIARRVEDETLYESWAACTFER